MLFPDSREWGCGGGLVRGELLNQGLFTQLCVQFRKDYISCPSKYPMNSHGKKIQAGWESQICWGSVNSQRIALMFSLTMAWKHCMDSFQSDNKTVRVRGNNLIQNSFSAQQVTSGQFCTCDEDISTEAPQGQFRKKISMCKTCHLGFLVVCVCTAIFYFFYFPIQNIFFQLDGGRLHYP